MLNNMQLIYTLIGLLIGGGIVYVLARPKKEEPLKNEDNNTGFQLLMQQVSELQKTVDQKLGESEKSIRESMMHQSSQSASIISDITERLTRLDEGNKQVLNF
ncbi:MAG: DNA recombination protein RmuC, partial [Patescibacteria group bacterium]